MKVNLTIPGHKYNNYTLPHHHKALLVDLYRTLAIDILLRERLRAHMDKYRLKCQRLSEIPIFQNLVKLRFYLTLKIKNYF